MGKIKTEGYVNLEFDPDYYEIAVTVSTESESSGGAITEGKKKTEALLHALQNNLQLTPDSITADSETVCKSRFNEQRNQFDYEYMRSLLLRFPADNHVREAVTDLFAKTDCVTYNVSAKLNDENHQKQIALEAAVQCAREKAEEIAAALHCRVCGFEEIRTDGASDFRRTILCAMADGAVPAANSLAADLQNPKIPINGEVSVVWLTEPLA